MLADVFNNFRNLYLEVYGIDPSRFFSAPVLVWEAALKNTKVKLDLLTDIDILLTLEKGIRGGICHAIHQFAKANNKYMKDYDQNFRTLSIVDVHNLYGFIKNTSPFSKDFIENYHKDSYEKYYLEVDISKNYMTFTMTYPFCLKE